jgi:hypothetical protein
LKTKYKDADIDVDVPTKDISNTWKRSVYWIIRLKNIMDDILLSKTSHSDELNCEYQHREHIRNRRGFSLWLIDGKSSISMKESIISMKGRPHRNIEKTCKLDNSVEN